MTSLLITLGHVYNSQPVQPNTYDVYTISLTLVHGKEQASEGPPLHDGRVRHDFRGELFAVRNLLRELALDPGGLHSQAIVRHGQI